MQDLDVKTQLRGRFNRPRRFCLVCAAVLGVSAMAWGDSGYLTFVGPAPLRFHALPILSTNVFVPPMPAPMPQPPMPTPVSNGTSALDYTNSTAFPEFSPLPELPVTGTNQTVVQPENSQPGEVISPQMLLKYFNKATNGAASTIITPFDFTPPKSGETPQSKATYVTP